MLIKSKHNSQLDKAVFQIENEELRTAVTKLLDTIPTYFWTATSSSSGKYHPDYARGEGGLVKHTLACTMFAKELFNLTMFTKLENRDEIIAALILHDTF